MVCSWVSKWLGRGSPEPVVGARHCSRPRGGCFQAWPLPYGEAAAVKQLGYEVAPKGFRIGVIVALATPFFCPLCLEHLTLTWPHWPRRSTPEPYCRAVDCLLVGFVDEQYPYTPAPAPCDGIRRNEHDFRRP